MIIRVPPGVHGIDKSTFFFARLSHIFGNERARDTTAQLRGPEGLGKTPAVVLHAPDERNGPEKYVRATQEPGTRAVHGVGTRPPGVGAAVAGNGRFADAQRT